MLLGKSSSLATYPSAFKHQVSESFQARSRSLTSCIPVRGTLEILRAGSHPRLHHRPHLYPYCCQFHLSETWRPNPPLTGCPTQVTTSKHHTIFHQRVILSSPLHEACVFSAHPYLSFSLQGIKPIPTRNLDFVSYLASPHITLYRPPSALHPNRSNPIVPQPWCLLEYILFVIQIPMIKSFSSCNMIQRYLDGLIKCPMCLFD